jgi:hypothetical protein
MRFATSNHRARSSSSSAKVSNARDELAARRWLGRGDRGRKFRIDDQAHGVTLIVERQGSDARSGSDATADSDNCRYSLCPPFRSSQGPSGFIRTETARPVSRPGLRCRGRDHRTAARKEPGERWYLAGRGRGRAATRPRQLQRTTSGRLTLSALIPGARYRVQDIIRVRRQEPRHPQGAHASATCDARPGRHRHRHAPGWEPTRSRAGTRAGDRSGATRVAPLG